MGLSFLTICLLGTASSSFHILLIPDASNAISVGVLLKILLKAQFPKPTIAPIGPPYRKPPRLFCTKSLSDSSFSELTLE